MALRLGALGLIMAMALSAACVTILSPATMQPAALESADAVSPATATDPALSPTMVSPPPEPSKTKRPKPPKSARPAQTPTPAALPTDPTPSPAPTLSSETPARYGSTDLTTGFEQDETPPGFPHQVFVWSGGPVDVAYLDAGCTGFASMNPDYTVRYMALPGTMGSDLLRFYTISSNLVIRFVAHGTSDERWFCSDLSAGAYGSAFDFHDPKSGRYDIWIASPVEGGRDPGWLFVTEQPEWHP